MSGTSNGAVELALFDLDGCLVDSTPAITSALLHALVQAGIEGHRQEDLVWCVGPPLFDSVTELLSGSGVDQALAPAVVDAYRAYYRETALERTQVIVGIPETLGTLADAGIRLGVVTSKPSPIAVPLLEGVGLRHHFEAVHAPDLDETMEVKAVTLRRALDDLAPGRPASAAVMIGDRSHDVVAGIACGTRTVGVTWGAGDHDELRDAGADHVVEAPAELTAVLGIRPTGNEVERSRP